LRHNHAGTGYGSVSNNNFTQADPYPQLGLYIILKSFIGLLIMRLKRESCTDGISGQLKLSDKGITANFAVLFRHKP
jgi:hypothetical protein